MLTLTNFSAGYGGKAVVDVPSLTVARGDKCLITGASGSGKTTLLYAIAGLGHIMSGTVLVKDTDIYKLKASARDRFRGEHIGIVFQAFYLIKSLTVLENVLLNPFVNNRSQDTDYARHLLERLGVGGLAHAPATDMSQGQAQRVAVARALISKPEILLADEPTSSLDDRAAEQVLSLLQSLAEETQTTLIVSSHDSRIKKEFELSVGLGEAA